jgi:hypothetical protein
MKRQTRAIGRWTLAVVAFSLASLAGCGHSSSTASDAGSQGTGASQAATLPAAPAAATTGGFDGARAYKHVEQLVAIGPHPAGSPGNQRAQQYIIAQLKSFG